MATGLCSCQQKEKQKERFSQQQRRDERPRRRWFHSQVLPLVHVHLTRQRARQLGVGVDGRSFGLLQEEQRRQADKEGLQEAGGAAARAVKHPAVRAETPLFRCLQEQNPPSTSSSMLVEVLSRRPAESCNGTISFDQSRPSRASQMKPSDSRESRSFSRSAGPPSL